MAPVKSNEIKMNTDTQRLMLPNGTNRSLTKSNESLPQTGNKTTWASFSLTIIGGLISMLGLVGIKKKNK
ncbi:LPXTG cell wall anchor domain-containing protein [uncultured Lactobacillus sp.]|uniref:LPXTG cell wall anchor domain-containing protein n=1 Tax=uncultured Lactobacillus sp. TaxID=153152 RepID=UPI002805997B|nr:LPXTG cell wall anchor domain-containing protein [uncultured Lactobacillus sp.]